MTAKKLPQFHTVTTFGAELGVSGMTIRNWMADRRLRADATTVDGRALFLPRTLVAMRNALADNARQERAR
jgi:hypothetical protein